MDDRIVCSVDVRPGNSGLDGDDGNSLECMTGDRARGVASAEPPSPSSCACFSRSSCRCRSRLTDGKGLKFFDMLEARPRLVCALIVDTGREFNGWRYRRDKRMKGHKQFQKQKEAEIAAEEQHTHSRD